MGRPCRGATGPFLFHTTSGNKRKSEEHEEAGKVSKHRTVNGRLLQMNKSYGQLKQKQKEKNLGVDVSGLSEADLGKPVG